MAKSKSFLGLKRGLAAGLVYSVGMDGKGKKQQVVRGQAETIANPKSIGQSNNRSFLSGASKLAAWLSEISDHAVQGVPFGQPNRSQFISMILALPEAQRPFAYKGDTYFYVPIGDVVPISRGSLSQIGALIEDEETGIAIEQFNNVNMSALNLQERDIITIIQWPATGPNGELGRYKPTYTQVVVIEGAAPVNALTGEAVTLRYVAGSPATNEIPHLGIQDGTAVMAVIHERKTSTEYLRSDAYVQNVPSISTNFAVAAASFRDGVTAARQTFGNQFLDGGDISSSSWGGALVAFGLQNKDDRSASFTKYVPVLGALDANGNYYLFTSGTNDVNAKLIDPFTGEAREESYKSLNPDETEFASFIGYWVNAEQTSQNTVPLAGARTYNAAYGHL